MMLTVVCLLSYILQMCIDKINVTYIIILQVISYFQKENRYKI